MVSIDSILDQYQERIFDIDRDGALEVLYQGLENGLAAEDLIGQVVLPAMNQTMAALVKSDDATLSQHYITAKVSAE